MKLELLQIPSNDPEMEMAMDMVLLQEIPFPGEIYVNAPAHDGPVLDVGCYQTPCRPGCE